MAGWVVGSGRSGQPSNPGPIQEGLAAIAAVIGGFGVGRTAKEVRDLVIGARKFGETKRISPFMSTPFSRHRPDMDSSVLDRARSSHGSTSAAQVGLKIEVVKPLV